MKDGSGNPDDSHHAMLEARFHLGAKYVSRASQMKLPEVQASMTAVIDAIYAEAKTRALKSPTKSPLLNERHTSESFLERLKLAE